MTLRRDDFGRKIVEAEIVKDGTPTVRMKPHIGTLLSSSYHIALRELKRLEEKVEAGGTLDYNELRKYRMLTQSTVELAKEERAQDAAKDPSKMDIEVLLAKAEEARKILGGESDEVRTLPKEES